jgi:hypothetical protein
VPRKWQKLLTLKPGIAELRRKGASYQAITEILRAADVPRLAHDRRAVLPGCTAPVPSTKAAPSYFLKLAVSTTVLLRGVREQQRPRIADPRII